MNTYFLSGINSERKSLFIQVNFIKTGCEGVECIWMPVVVVTIYWTWIIWQYRRTEIKNLRSFSNEIIITP